MLRGKRFFVFFLSNDMKVKPRVLSSELYDLRARVLTASFLRVEDGAQF